MLDIKLKPADKIEPKFHEGDWVVSPNGVYWHIDAIQNGRYQVSSDSGKCAEWPLDTNIYHRFTIKDANDGDVLCCESGWTCIFKALDNHTNTFSSYCFMDSDKWFCNTGSECHTLDERFIKAYNGEISPATKEQRDLLFQKMTEAGYEWDAEKKELKRIEQKHTEWSEEDEIKIKSIIAFLKSPSLCAMDENKGIIDANIKYLKSFKYRVLPQPKQEWSEEDEKVLNQITKDYEKANESWLKGQGSLPFGNRIKWLKSLRPQNTWKPSDEQIEILDMVLTNESMDDNIARILRELREQLKKLKGE